jgi:(2Fe-2S) ferredoxin
MKYRKHIFVCTNTKDNGKTCCGQERGMELVEAFRLELKRLEIKDVRAQKAGCLDLCKFGPAAMVYPEGTCYGHLSPEDVPRIVQEHIVNNVPVADKALEF